MKKRNVCLLMVMAVALVMFSMNAWAGAISLNDPTNQNDPSGQPANPGEGTLTAWLNNVVIPANSGNPNVPQITVSEILPREEYDGPEDHFTSVTVSDFTGYVVLHWGGQGGGVYYAYYVTGGATFLTPNGREISFVAKYGQVPVPAAVWLFGSGIVGLVGVRRKMRK